MLYLRRGFSSLFDYVKRGLGYSDGATYRRIGAMKLCAQVAGTRERLRDGSLTLDAAAQLQSAFGSPRSARNASDARYRSGAECRGGCGAGHAAERLGSNGFVNVAAAEAGPLGTEGAGGRGGRQELTRGHADAGRGGPRPRGAGRSIAAPGRGALGAQGGHRRGVPARPGAAQGAAVARRPTHDVGTARRAAGQGRAGPPRPRPAATARSTPCRQPVGQRRANFGAEAEAAPGRRRRPGAEPVSDPRRGIGLQQHFGAGAAARYAGERAFGAKAARQAYRTSSFGAEAITGCKAASSVEQRALRAAGRRHGFGGHLALLGPGDPGGGASGGLAARQRALLLCGPSHRTPLRVTASAGDRSQHPVRPRRQRGAGQPQTPMCGPSPPTSSPPPRRAGISAGACRLIDACRAARFSQHDAQDGAPSG